GGNSNHNAAERGGNVVHVIHHSDQFTGCWHAGCSSFFQKAIFNCSGKISKAPRAVSHRAGFVHLNLLEYFVSNSPVRDSSHESQSSDIDARNERYLGVP